MTATPQDPLHPLTVDIVSVQDVFSLRRSGQEAAESLRMERQDQVRLATALSELGRDRLGATDLTATFDLHEEGEPRLVVTLQWASGTEPSPEALELATRLVHRVRYQPDIPHSQLVLEQPVPSSEIIPGRRRRLSDALRRAAPATMAEELRAQTRDLIATLEETRAQREELRRLNEELEETNRGVLALYTELSQELETTNSGVVALHTELDDKSRRLREASEAKTRFWTNVSHELRTPVNSVVALSRLLLDPGSAYLSEEQHRQLSLIASSGQTLLDLVNDLLDVAKAESGQLEPRLGPVDLHALVGQLGGALRNTVCASRVVLKMPDLESFPAVVTDEVLLTRILRNLLSNALKFTEEGEVSLTVGTSSGPAGAWLSFTVADSGIGIPLAEQQRVFEEFYQVPGLHQRGRPGTGLGLPYARTLAELLGGSLVLTSAEGQGTQVDVRLPNLFPDQVADHESAGTLTGHSSARQPSDSGPRTDTSGRADRQENGA
ncbi:sensor histidine kinase [Streptomyces albipurpureus]|uniref:histidine kinase n=1 Tax=Streptomyces albipurpureus TaxID=2897419 RepID=A0ABT0UMR7_9ACTN|nr:HAMP domain-containing sensor histidine kinase [Streptomyces sp. CWNU-1]MCM2389597.1 HAMP domain-containing histidine kinase [Streptomyces sp. CWNU-1]